MMQNQNTILITGGAGFIGSNFVRQYIDQTNKKNINFDKLTYAGNTEFLDGILDHPLHISKKVDITEADVIEIIFSQYRPDEIMHFAAESRVDSSIDGSAEFIQANITGTYVLLEAVLKYWKQLENEKK